MNLIVTDFDGTFFDKNYLNNIEFVDNIRSNNKFVIATGRNIKSLEKDLKIKCDYYICNDGGYILDSKKNIIYKNYIDNNDIQIIHNRIKELNYKEYFFDNINEFNNTPFNKYNNKVSIRIDKTKNIENDLSYLLKDLNNIYGYISNNWINILNKNSDKGTAIEYLLNNNLYDNIYVIGNDINDFNMLNKFNGYLVSNQPNKNFNCINNFLDLKNIIKK